MRNVFVIACAGAGAGCVAPARRRRTHAVARLKRPSRDASSNSEYATGVTSSVSSSASDCPPKITKPIAWLVPDPIPLETISGIIPATNAKVVIRIGRSRSRLARMIASRVERPVALSWFAAGVMSFTVGSERLSMETAVRSTSMGGAFKLAFRKSVSACSSAAHVSAHMAAVKDFIGAPLSRVASIACCLQLLTCVLRYPGRWNAATIG